MVIPATGADEQGAERETNFTGRFSLKSLVRDGHSEKILIQNPKDVIGSQLRKGTRQRESHVRRSRKVKSLVSLRN